MPCTSTITAYQSPFGGKPKFKKPRETDGYLEIQIPCNECISCLYRNAMDWATRQYCESVTSQGIGTEIFLTTTYSDENLPAFGHYEYSDMQAFWKRLRAKLTREAKNRDIDPEKIKFKYVTAPEYGDKTRRPHFHSNVFNLWIPDLVIYGKNEHGNTVMRSQILQECWQKGLIDIQPFGIGSARYLSNHNIKQNGDSLKKELKLSWYAMRKRIAEEQDTENPFDPETGLIFPEKMPLPRVYCSGGIGRSYLEKYQDEIYSNDFITIRGNKYPVPRYFDKKLFENNPDLWETVMLEREQNQRDWTEKELKALNEARLHKKRFLSKAGKI